MAERESPGGLLALGAVGLGACCGIPLLLSAGALGVLTGAGLRSWAILVAGLAVVVFGLPRWYRQRQPTVAPNHDTSESTATTESTQRDHSL